MRIKMAVAYGTRQSRFTAIDSATFNLSIAQRQVGIYYINKKEAGALFENGQSQVLSRDVRDGFNQSITEEALPVNMKRMGWHDDFELNGFRGGERERAVPRCFCAKKKRRQSRRLRSEPQTCSALAGANFLRCPSKPDSSIVYSMPVLLSTENM